MYNIKPTFIILVLLLGIGVNAYSQRDYLYKEFRRAGGTTAFADIEKWKQEKYSAIISDMASLPAEAKANILAAADKAREFNWPSLTAALYLQYRDNGNRVNFENAQFERRKVLSALVAGELAGGNGKYLPQIANGLWLILEESTWVLPAHIGAQKAGSGLPDPSEPVVDLFAGETAATISYTQFLLRKELDKLSPQLNRRIDFELKYRITEPFLARNDFWWMGFNGREMNNWNIWINTNVLQVALLSEQDTDTRNKMIDKAIRSADFFLNGYPEDGGCDEGPTYWGHAGGKLIEFINWLQIASNQQLNWSNNELIHQIGNYIYKMHVDSNRYVNFADASAQTIPPPHTVFLYGLAFNDPALQHFGAYLAQIENPDSNKIKNPSLAFFIYNLEYRRAMLATQPAAPYTAVNWLPNLQVLSMRSEAGTAKGLFFAAQGGHNAESHNHNDVGNFVLYMNGKPAIIDVGVGTYTKQTFSADRYKLWFMQSQWHNCPTINGVQQHDGRKFQAKNVSFIKNKLSMDLSAAYPEAAAVKEWQRSFIFQPAKRSLQLDDQWELSAYKEPTRLHFITSLEADTSKPGRILLKSADATLQISYNAAAFELQIEKQEVADGRLTPVWGDHIGRISLQPKSNTLKGSSHIVFTMLK
ncbi:heparinase [Chitinophaga silvatica]|uniref:Heparinase n=1 Tax=Chitinophaga silvatica TaxID=2282649 RepID=A0A3E1YEF8_9BACT|nr:heparinase II/III family protein [Chitinophaga silvatica]RFS24677.1 heparinase [Chitinophaga silvatica]